ncbi:MAG: nitroreductase family protein [Candidatus Roizmanbacteria bacterium]|nr:nitroreductase family protein [Candidatus Roizmanbacteria bacterium]
MMQNTTVPILSLLNSRFSPKEFLQEPVSQEHYKLLFEAARWSPSSYNRQPWFYYYSLQNTPGFETLAKSLVEGNAWAKKAPLLILGCYIDSDEHGKNAYAQYDLGQSTFSLVMQAQALGYYSHQMGGFDREKAKTLLQLPPEHIPHVMIAIGKIGNIDKKDPSRTRKETLAKKVE